LPFELPIVLSIEGLPGHGVVLKSLAGGHLSSHVI